MEIGRVADVVQSLEHIEGVDVPAIALAGLAGHLAPAVAGRTEKVSLAAAFGTGMLTPAIAGGADVLAAAPAGGADHVPVCRPIAVHGRAEAILELHGLDIPLLVRLLLIAAAVAGRAVAAAPTAAGGTSQGAGATAVGAGDTSFPVAGRAGHLPLPGAGRTNLHVLGSGDLVGALVIGKPVRGAELIGPDIHVGHVEKPPGRDVSTLIGILSRVDIPLVVLGPQRHHVDGAELVGLEVDMVPVTSERMPLGRGCISIDIVSDPIPGSLVYGQCFAPDISLIHKAARFWVRQRTPGSPGS